MRPGLASCPAEVVLVDRNNYHLFQPLLYQVATAGLEPEEIAKPARAILRGQKNLDFRMLDVTRVDFAASDSRTVPVRSRTISRSRPGGETNFFGSSRCSVTASLEGHPRRDRDPHHVLTWLSNRRCSSRCERRRALLTFIVVGGGPTGVEWPCAVGTDPAGPRQRLPAAQYQGRPCSAASRQPTSCCSDAERLREAAGKTLWRKYVEVRSARV